MLVFAGCWPGKPGVDALYPIIFVDDDHGRESQYRIEHGQYLRCLGFVVGRARQQQLVVHLEIVAVSAQSVHSFVLFFVAFKCQGDNFYLLLGVLFEVIYQKLGFIPAIGTPGAHDLDDLDLVFITCLIQTDHFTFGVFKRKINLAVTRFEIG